MAERRETRRGGRTSTRRREPSDRDEQELPETDEPETDEPETDEPEDDEPEDVEDAEGQPRMTAGEATAAALDHIGALTSKQPEGITEIRRTEDGWTVGVEIVEDQRIPSSADILATYETTIDADGELVSYRRTRRYARGRGDAEE